MVDDFGERSDWIELRNTTTVAVNLLDWCLTDDSGDLTKWRFPATNLNAGAYEVGVLSPRHEDGVAWFQTKLARAHA